MSDLFHEAVPNDFIFQAFEVMKKAPWHRFQILTKRASAWLNSLLNYLGLPMFGKEYQWRVPTILLE